MQLSLPDDLVVHIPPTGSSDAVFEEICSNHPELRIEQTREGEILIMSPAGNESSNRNLKILRQLGNWTLSDGRGEAFDSNTMFRPPDGSKMGPAAAWISRARLAAFPAGEREKFLPLAPEFVIELRSPNDSLPALQTKMENWISNGVAVGWLIDADERRVWIYTSSNVREAVNPSQVSGDGPIRGFVLELDEVYRGLKF